MGHLSEGGLCRHAGPAALLLHRRLANLHELATQVDLHEDVVDGQHVRADAVLLEPLAVRAVELARVEVALGHAPIGARRADPVNREADGLKVLDVLDAGVILVGQRLEVHRDEPLCDLVAAGLVVLLEDEVLEGVVLVLGLADPDVRLLVVDVPERLQHHLLGHRGHVEAEHGGDVDRIHLDELRDRLADEHGRACLEQARDLGPVRRGRGSCDAR